MSNPTSTDPSSDGPPGRSCTFVSPERIGRLAEIIELLQVNSHIKGVTFDMFGTLVHWTNSLEERHALMWDAASRIVSDHGIYLSPREYQTVRDAIWYAEKNRSAMCGREIDAQTTLADIAKHLAVQKHSPLSPQAVSRIVMAWENGFTSVDQAALVPAIDGLKVLSILRVRRIRIGLISNYPYKEEAVRSILDQMGFLAFFDTIVVSSTVGYMKSNADPSFTIFRTACDALRMSRDAVLHVGDDLVADYQAPRRYGMNAIICSAIAGRRTGRCHLQLIPLERIFLTRAALMAIRRKVWRHTATARPHAVP
jgi:HAD superfamily hydrolase (TIGR01549 family)